MYLDNNQVLQVRIEEREPVARVFTLGGNSFYLDSDADRLPLREGVTTRVPVFTGFPSDREKLASPDSALLRDMVKMGRYILTDSFWMAQVGEVHIQPEKGFEITPEIGDQLVIVGDAENLPSKFDKLYTFYRKAWIPQGINTYKQLDLRFQNQVVARREVTDSRSIDSIRLQHQEPVTRSYNNATVPESKAMAVKQAPVKVVKPGGVKNQKTTEPLNNISNKSTLSKQAKNNAAKKTVIKKGNTHTAPKAVMQKPKTENNR
jgi:cell division protein FtsQ